MGLSSSDVVLLGGGADTAAFDPVTALGWKHLYYAGGPAFQALGLSNGANMASVNWPDEIATNAAPLDAGNGGYATADSQINSKPSVYTISGLSNKRHSTTVAGGAQVSLPYSVICIFQFDSGASTQYVYDGANLGGSGQRVLFRIQPGPTWSLYMGTDQAAGTPTSGLKASRVYATSGNDVLTVNGSTIISGVDSGGGSWQGVSLYAFTSGTATDRYAFYGVYPGDITADGQWSAFQTWVTSTYGVSIS